MSKYTETVKNETPKAVIAWQKNPDGSDNYRWGLSGGKMPLLNLIGFIVKVQGDLSFCNPEHCDDKALVIAYIEETGKFTYFLNRSIPTDSLVGALELMKVQLIGMHMAQQAQAASSPIVGPDGGPIRRG